MRKLVWVLLAVALASLTSLAVYFIVGRVRNEVETGTAAVGTVVLLPLPRRVTQVVVEDAILLRRSIREFTRDPVKLENLSLILWAAYGITEPRRGLKASPSAGATYPLELYVVVGDRGVDIGNGSYLAPGVYKYDSIKHTLTLVKRGDVRADLARAALGQTWVERAPVNIVICAVFERTTARYGRRGEVRYVPMEVGHAGQNIYLMATALGYGTVAIGAFHDDEVARVVSVARGEVPLYIKPIGVPARPYRVTFEEIGDFIRRARGG